MGVKLRKPILVAGVGLSLALWVWDSVGHSLGHVNEFSILGTVALGAGVWWLQSRVRSGKSIAGLMSIERQTAEVAIAQAQNIINNLETEAPDRDISDFKQQIAQLSDLLNRKNLQIAVTGGKNVGKTALKQKLTSEDIATEINIVETEALLTQDDSEQLKAQETIFNSDLLLFVTAGDLTDSEWYVLQKLRKSPVRSLVVFNKQDQYLPEERTCILQQLQHRVSELISAEDVIATSVEPRSQLVRQHQEDGTVKEWVEVTAPDLGNLGDRLVQIIAKEREQMIWATTWRSATKLKTQVKQILDRVRRDRANPVIEQYQWIAAGAAFANPVASLDLLATAAINTQMLVDLSNIYQQNFDLSQAQTATGTIGKLMLQLGLVELSTQAIGSILKTNAFTYVAGGAVQGVSAAYLTRLAGLSLVEYFQEQEVCLDYGQGLNFDRLGQKLKTVFEQNQRGAFLQSFVKQTISRLLPETQQSLSSSPG
ncbi:MAG: slr1306 family protein [Xenococcaceae cyanobacterium]